MIDAYEMSASVLFHESSLKGGYIGGSLQRGVCPFVLDIATCLGVIYSKGILEAYSTDWRRLLENTSNKKIKDLPDEVTRPPLVAGTGLAIATGPGDKFALGQVPILEVEQGSIL
jgi:hypothetical protein